MDISMDIHIHGNPELTSRSAYKNLHSLFTEGISTTTKQLNKVT